MIKTLRDLQVKCKEIHLIVIKENQMNSRIEQLDLDPLILLMFLRLANKEDTKEILI